MVCRIVIERSKTKTFHFLQLTLNGFSCKYRQIVVGVEHEAHVKGGAGKEFLVAVSRAPRVPRACLRSSKKSEKLTFVLQARLQVAYLP